MKDDILKYDPSFTEESFKTFVDNVFIQIYLNIMTKSIENVRHFMSKEIYQKFNDEVTNLKNRDITQMYDEINVKGTDIENTRIENGKIIISVKLISRYMDYIIDSNGNLLSGNNTSRVQKVNHLVFEKLINASSLGTVRKCPGCGASIDVNANGVCAYCGTTFNLEDKSWILTSLVME